MFRAITRAFIAATLWLLGMAGPAVAQQSSASPDPFAAVHRMLNSAADAVLASAPSAPDSGSQPVPTNVQQPPTAMERTANTPALARVQALRPVIDPILREEGVPVALAGVVLIESGGQPMALSPKGARGIWQFMPDTARRYGLVVDADRDERTDVVRSTRAAARYLHDLYRVFKSWPLALAAYNAGEDFVKGALAKSGDSEFEAIRSRLPLETRNYVPAVLQAMGQVGDVLSVKEPASESGRVLYAAGDFD